MFKNLVKRIIPLFLTLLLVVTLCPLEVFAASSGNFEPVTGVTVSVLGATNTSMSGGVITTTAKGSAGLMGFGASAKTATITVYNDSDSDATLSFDWTATSVNQLTIDGSVKTDASGSFAKLVTAGGSFVITVVTAKNSTVNTLALSNFSLTSGSVSYNVTFDYNSALGSVTVNGAAAASGYVQSVEVGNTLTLNATAKGSTFLGWIDGDGFILSKTAQYTYAPAGDITIKAVFAASSPWFLVSNEYLYEGLTLAAQKASSAATKTLVLMNNATLPAGDYTIPAGVTMLIPFDSANTLYTTEPANTAKTRTAPSVYRTLTMASGANITVNGAISISSKVVSGSAGKIAGGPSGPYGHIKMEENSNITVNDGANLYTWGFITGKGAVLAKSGATVHECFQFEDFRGGTQTTGMKNKVFPLSQYYIQNIEVPMTLEAGATEKSYTNITMKVLSENQYGASLAFISSSDAMFNLTSGSVTKYYDGTKDRLVVEVNGTIKMSPIVMPVGYSSINSKDYVLPINNNLTVRVNSGSAITMTQDMAMLPGSEIIVEEDALCDIAAGVSLYAYDADQWDKYCWENNTNAYFAPLDYAPGRTYTRTVADLVDAKVVINGTIDATKGYLYTTAGGANVISTGSGKIKAQPGTATSTYQVLQNIDGDNDNYVAIPITSAKLRNADGSFVETAGSSGDYDYVNGVWKKTCYTHAHVGAVTTPAGCETEGVRTYTCECGDTYTEAIAPTGHTAGAGATCSSAQTCTVCGKELAAQLAHTPGADATCTSAQTCTVCGTVIVAALGHTEVIDAAVAATCTQTGLTEGKHCSVCGEVLVAQQEVAALGHSYGEWTLAQAATKDADGYFEKTCSACGDTQKDVFSYIEISDVLITVTDSGKQIDMFASAAYSEQFASFDVCVAQNGNTTKITDYVLNGNSNVFTYNTLSDEALEISVRAVTKNGNAVTSDSVIKNIDRILGTAGEKFVVLETLEGSDTNEDGYTNIKDLVRLKKMIAELEEKSEAADISGDGNVAVNDMTLLAKYLVSGKRGIAAYTVAFTDGNGNVLQTVIVPEGFSAQPDVTPGKDGYVFVGWDKDFIHVTQDLVVNAVYNTVE